MSVGNEPRVHTHTHTHTGNHHGSLFHNFAGIPHVEEKTPTSCISSANTSCSSACSYLKAELHQAAGAHQSRDLSHSGRCSLFASEKLQGWKGSWSLLLEIWFVTVSRRNEMVWGSRQWWQQHADCMVVSQLPGSPAPQDSVQGGCHLSVETMPVCPIVITFEDFYFKGFFREREKSAMATECDIGFACKWLDQIILGNIISLLIYMG